jgi:hypothetical protein
MRVIWWSYGVDLTDNKSGPAKQETQHIPRAIAPKAMYLRNENGGRLIRIIVLMIPMSIGYATDAFPPAPTIRELTPRGLDQHGQLSKVWFFWLDLVGFTRIWYRFLIALVVILISKARPKQSQTSHAGFTSNENTIPFSGRNFRPKKE